MINQDKCNDYVMQKLRMLEEEMTEMKKKHDHYEKTAEKNRYIEEKEEEIAKTWVRKQESNDEKLQLAMKEQRKELESQIEKIRSENHEQQSIMKEIYSELSAVRKDFLEHKNFGKEMINELRSLCSEIKDIKQEQNSQKLKLTFLVSREKFGARKTLETGLEGIKKDIHSLRQESKTILDMLEIRKQETELLKLKQKETYDSMQEFIKNDLNVISAENAKSRYLLEAVTRNIAIRTSIVGEWKLLKIDNFVEYSKRNAMYPHEVHTCKMKFEIAANKLYSYFFDDRNYVLMKCERIGNRKKWRYYVENNCIKSVELNGFQTETAATEKCTRYVNGDYQLVLINEMGGCVCTRIYEKIQ